MRRLIPVIAIALLAGCASPQAPAEPTIAVWEGWEPSGTAELVLESTDFVDEGEFPASIELTIKCGGPNVRPELHWSGAPEGTESFVITFTYDGSPSSRWLAFDIPATVDEIPASEDEPGPETATMGRTSYNTVDFFGPCSLKGEKFRLWFTVYALDTTLGLEEGVSADDVRLAGEGHVLAAAELAGYLTGPTE